jgi:hypothetical protein
MARRGHLPTTGVQVAVVVAACVTCSPAMAHAAPLSAFTATTVSTTTSTSASWGVVVTQATVPPYLPGPAVTIPGSVLGARYYTVANVGTRMPSSITYRLTSTLGLSVSMETCPTPWTVVGLCASTPTPVAANTAQSTTSKIPALGEALYLKVLVLVTGNGTLQIEASPPNPDLSNT